jgi:hypothetical protein
MDNDFPQTAFCVKGRKCFSGSPGHPARPGRATAKPEALQYQSKNN